MEDALENLEHVIDLPNQPRDEIGNNYEIPENLQVCGYYISLSLYFFIFLFLIFLSYFFSFIFYFSIYL